MRSEMLAKGRYVVQHFNAAGELLDTFDADNLIVNEGLDHLASVAFTQAQQVAQWYLGLYANNYQPTPSDKAATIAINAGETQSYGGNARQPFNAVEGAQQATNASNPASFTFTNAATIYGAFLISTPQLAGTNGVLMSAAQFSTPKTVAANDQLVLTYVFSIASN